MEKFIMDEAFLLLLLHTIKYQQQMRLYELQEITKQIPRT